MKIFEIKFNKICKLFCKLKKYFGKHILKFFLNNVVLKNEGYIIINKKNLIKFPELFNI